MVTGVGFGLDLGSVFLQSWQGAHREGQCLDEEAELRVCRELGEEHQPQLNQVALGQESSFSRGTPCRGVSSALATGLCARMQRSH